MLRDDLLIVIPDFVFDEGGMRREIGTVRWVKPIRTYNDGPFKAAVDAAYPKTAAWIRTFETDPETVIVLPDYIGVQIKRATLGELRQWRNTHAATTVASWRRFLDTFETTPREAMPPMPRDSITEAQCTVCGDYFMPLDGHECERPAAVTRLERVKAGLEKDQQGVDGSYPSDNHRKVPEFRLRPYREVLSLEVDDPTGDDIAADAVRGK